MGEVLNAGCTRSERVPVLSEHDRLMERYRKGMAYLDDNSIPAEQREKWQGEFTKICKRLSEIMEDGKNVK